MYYDFKHSKKNIDVTVYVDRFFLYQYHIGNANFKDLVALYLDQPHESLLLSAVEAELKAK